jgi:NAD(P)-dependent dehydrogenase (short-subunit alcohol dehydrogenase family)
LANRYYFSGGKCKCENEVNHKIIIITGANTGIGYETALELAKRGGEIILACRSISRGEEAADHIKEKIKDAKLKVEYLDLASLQSVRDFVERFKQNYDHLDILINNAGKLLLSKN